jgi:pyruvate dehydrogenase E1 component
MGLDVTPYINTIPVSDEPDYPGDLKIERRIKSVIRWNALMMVARANHFHPGLGGHISTYQSAATLYEVGFNWFFQGGRKDLIYFQGHASPGIYSRAFLEGRLSLSQLENFRREVEKGKGLSSYPHPWLMPDFWEVPTVSMGLGAINAIYQARFNRYLQARGLAQTEGKKVWCFLGDGEMDEPEAGGALQIAAREKLDNLIFVINANLQRLDGPVRGNGKIIQELEGIFRGAGWNVLKVIWGNRWDPLLAADSEGVLKSRMREVTDGQYQTYAVKDGGYTRQHFFGTDPRLLKMVESLSDDEIKGLNRGGHDPKKVHAAYAQAASHKGQPTVVIAKTIKGYGLEKWEGRMTTHQNKKLEPEELRAFRDRFELPVTDSQCENHYFIPPEAVPDLTDYLHERRKALGGYIPTRKVQISVPLELPSSDWPHDFFTGSKGRPVSTTMVMVSILSHLLRDKKIGKRIVPIVPDEARTFGMDPLITQVGIYAPAGQLYEPADRSVVMYYREAPDGQIFEEGITEAGAMGTFTAAATSYATHGVPMVPFYFFYSMYGPQRIGDEIWAAADMRSRGFLLGAVSGRTALNGEGLQHQDGHSPLLASTVPNLISYHPAFAYELAVIVKEGLRRMFEEGEDIFYYLTLHNEMLPMPAFPEKSEGITEGILKGIYLFSPAENAAAEILGSDATIAEALEAQKILAEKYGVSANVWSVTSYTELRREALEIERWNLHHPDETMRVPFVTQKLSSQRPVIAVSDFIKAVPDQIARWVPGGLYSLGTDGFGRSDTRPALRRYFEMDATEIVAAVLFKTKGRGSK